MRPGKPSYSPDIFHTFIQQSFDGYWVYDYQQHSTYYSTSLSNLLGYGPQDMPDGWPQLVCPQDLEKVKHTLHQLGTSQPMRLQARYRHKDGHTLWMLTLANVVQWADDGAPLKMMVGLIDISREKESEEQLKINRQQFKDAFEHSPIGMALVSLKGDWLRVNSRLSQLLGYTEEELLSITFQHITHPDDLDLDLGLLNKVLAGEIEHYQIEKRYFHKNGSIIWVQLNVSLVRDEAGNNLHFISQIQDITRRKKAQKDLEILTEKLSERNKKLADFAHIASHNLRSPVSNLATLVNMFANITDPAERELTFKHFEKVVNHLSSTLGDLIDTLKVQEDFDQSREKIAFEEILQKTREMLVAQITETHTVLEYNFEQAPHITYHRPYLESIFLNLITNAIKYRSPHRPPKILVQTGIHQGSIFLKVTDNGLGINLKRHGHKIFGLHKTFHRHKEAKGFGLFITRAQVEALGGSISVESEEGRGSVFTVHFDVKS